MNERETRALIDDYLRRLNRALEGIPTTTRRELVEDVRSHIEEAWAASPDKTPTAMREILERLGAPERLAQEERERLGDESSEEARGPGVLEIAAIVMTVLVWPIGIVLAWLSDRWSVRDKLIATAIPIGALLIVAPFVFVAPNSVLVSSAPVAAVAVEVDVDATSAATPAPLAASAPVSNDVPERVIASALVLAGLWGGPFVAAIYLALRMRPRPRRGALMLPVVAAMVIIVAIIAVYFVAAPVSPGSTSVTAWPTVIEPEQVW